MLMVFNVDEVGDTHEGCMVNVGKLVGAGSAEYYLEKVARGVEDYYLHAGEAPGMWYGSAAQDLGLAGEVAPDELMALLRGEDPATRERLAQPQRCGERVWGFDVTFRAPKSVSLLFALGEGAVPREVRSAHEAAFQAALAYLEREAAFGRRRVDGVIRPIGTSGLVAAAFQHRTSRAGDPLLHTHVLIANLVRGSDGRCGALDGRLLYTHAKAAGVLYQTELRCQLTRRLGVDWTNVRNGVAEVRGVPSRVIQAFSRRRQEITERMRTRGETSARAAQVATLDTRRGKDRDVTAAGLLPEWRERASELGFGPSELANVLKYAEPHAVDDQSAAAAIEELLSPDGLTAHASSFTRRDVVVALADRVGACASADDIERIADALLELSDVVTLSPTRDGAAQGMPAFLRRQDGRVIPGPDERRFTTTELLETETRLVDGALARQGRHRENAVASSADAALQARPSLSHEQMAMCRRLLSSADGVLLVRGHAGTGKTYALDACRDAWEMSGMRVLGCALSARAAAELQAGAGIASSTIHRLLVELDTEDRRRMQYDFGDGQWHVPHLVDIDRRTVLVVDEAGMVGTRQLAALLERAARAGTRVVLVGDDRQLPEIDSGGAFRALSERVGAVELTANRRQDAAWERDALRLLREGQVGAALDAYAGRGRVVTGASTDEVRSRMVADWWSVQKATDGEVVMIALRRSDVRELNGRAQAIRLASGEVCGPDLPIPGGAVAVGDRALARRNDRRLGIRNGDRGTVVVVDHDAGSLDLQLDGLVGQIVRLPAEYVAAGHVSLAYAVTAHSAQGMTVARALVLGDDAAYREWGYVALSRGREENRLYVVAGHADDDETGHGPRGEIRSALEEFAEALGRSRSQALALRLGDPLWAVPAEERTRLAGLSDASLIAELRRSVRDRVPAWSRPVDPGDAAIAKAEGRVAELRSRLEAAEQEAWEVRTRLESEGRFSRWRRGERRRDDERVLDAKEAWVRPRRSDLARAIEELSGLQGRRADAALWDAERRALREQGIAHGFALRDELCRRERRLARAEAADSARVDTEQPAYVIAAIGPRPDGIGAQRTWRDAASQLRVHREEHGITDPDRPLGSTPSLGRDAGIARVIDHARTLVAIAHEAPHAAPAAHPPTQELQEFVGLVRRHDAERALERRRHKQLAQERRPYRHRDHDHHIGHDVSHDISMGM